MPYLPVKHGADKVKRTRSQATARRQTKRLYATNHKRWLADRRIQLDKQPLCEHCEQMGRITPATDVDHINNSAKHESDFVPDNYQSLCRSCHSIKTKADNK